MGSAFRNLGRITKLFPNKWKFFTVIFFSIILAGAELFVFYSLKFLMDSVLSQDYSLFGRMVIALVCVTIGDATFRYLRGRLAGSYAERGIAVLRERLARHTVELPLKELDKRHTGDMLTRMSNDMNLVQAFVAQTLIDIFFMPLSALGALILLFNLHWKLTLVTLIALPIVFLLSAIAAGPVGRATKRIQENTAVVNSHIQDSITGMEVIRAFNLQESIGKRFDAANAKVVWWGVKLAFSRAMLTLITIFSTVAPFVICFGLGGYWAVKGEMTPGEVVAFINLLNPFATPIGRLPNLMGELRAQMEGAKRIFEILDEQKERENGETFPTVGQGTVISFEHVAFAYNPEGEQIVKDLTFDIKAGEKVAIVGPSGSGKTTLLKLLLGYYENYGGAIKVYGHELSEWNLKEMRNHMSLVSQDTYLFPGTLLENIGYGKLGSQPEKIYAAAKEANAHDFITQFEHGYESAAGEFGDKLSGGQKQRISIARAIVKEAPIILLDEATSSLDSHSEYLVQLALDDYMKQGKTALIIAHRLSTIQKADRILVIDGGKVVETGKHEELLARDGVYKKLYLRQLAAQKNDQLVKEAAV